MVLGGYRPPISTRINGYSITATDQVIAEYNPSRKYLAVVNLSAATVYLALGTAAVASQGIAISADGGSYEMVKDQNLVPLDVHAVAAAAGPYSISVQEISY